MRTSTGFPAGIALMSQLALALTLSATAAFGDDATTLADACPMREYSGESRDEMQRFIGELGLTAQQQTDIQIITSDYAVRFRDLARLASRTAGELFELSPSDATYRAKTDEASALAATSAAEMVVLLAEMRGKLHAVLTEAQRELLRQKIAEKKQQLEEKKLEYEQREESHDLPLDQFIG